MTLAPSPQDFDLPHDKYDLAAETRLSHADRSEAQADDAQPTSAAETQASSARRALKQLATAAWLAILLGFAMQGLVLTGKLLAGSVPTEAQIALDLAQGVTWSFFVCAGVALGASIAKARSVIGGLIGMISAPLAMGIAKGGQKAMAGAMGVSTQPAVVSLATLGLVRAIQYGLLGWLLASLVIRQDRRAWRYLGAGAAVGVTFGGGITALTVLNAASLGLSLTTAQIVGMGINEIVFPIGCSLVVFVAMQIGQHIKAAAIDSAA